MGRIFDVAVFYSDMSLACPSPRAGRCESLCVAAAPWRRGLRLTGLSELWAPRGLHAGAGPILLPGGAQQVPNCWASDCMLFALFVPNVYCYLTMAQE